MDFGGNECTHTRTDRGDRADDDEKAPGADGCQLILWRETKRERERERAFHVKTHFHTIMTDGPTDGRTVKLPTKQYSQTLSFSLRVLLNLPSNVVFVLCAFNVIYSRHDIGCTEGEGIMDIWNSQLKGRGLHATETKSS